MKHCRFFLVLAFGEPAPPYERTSSTFRTKLSQFFPRTCNNKDGETPGENRKDAGWLMENLFCWRGTRSRNPTLTFHHPIL